MTAKKIYPFIFSMLLLFACGSTEKNESETINTPIEENTQAEIPAAETTEKGPKDEIRPNTGALIFLHAYDERYLHEVDLFENPNLKQRFGNLLGNDFKLLDKNIQVSVPMKLDVENNVLFVHGIAPRSGGINEAALAIDIQNDVISVIIMEDRKLKTYQENKQIPMPQLLTEWKQTRANFDDATE